jgi:phospholipid/cholesterol/gamma-HCH transport system ATP-binding protein
MTRTLKESNGEAPVIQIKGLEKSFGDQEVLTGIDVDLRKGENLIVLGKSGTGKSVLIKCIVGLVHPDAGHIRVFDRDIVNVPYRELNEIRMRIGFLFQSAALYDSMTVRENLEFPITMTGKKPDQKDMDMRIEEVLENVGLTEAIDKMPSQLSGGMRKRIGLARTLILKPEIMLYDEPTTGLDPITSNEISNLIVDVQKKYHTSSMIITHDISCARHTANRVVIIKEGRIYAEGKFEELEKSEDEWIRSFFL